LDWGIHGRMENLKVTYVDRNAEGVLVTFADGYTYLFQSDFLFNIRLKEDQLTGHGMPKNKLSYFPNKTAL
jgi:hypothetical protein